MSGPRDIGPAESAVLAALGRLESQGDESLSADDLTVDARYDLVKSALRFWREGRPPLVACVHEWRLIDERPERHPWGSSTGRILRRWYCVHCRTNDVTDEHGGVK